MESIFGLKVTSTQVYLINTYFGVRRGLSFEWPKSASGWFFQPVDYSTCQLCEKCLDALSL